MPKGNLSTASSSYHRFCWLLCVISCYARYFTYMLYSYEMGWMLSVNDAVLLAKKWQQKNKFVCHAMPSATPLLLVKALLSISPSIPFFSTIPPRSLSSSWPTDPLLPKYYTEHSTTLHLHHCHNFSNPIHPPTHTSLFYSLGSVFFLFCCILEAL